MLQIKEWRPTKEAVKTSLLAFRESAAQPWKPTLLQRLESGWFEPKAEQGRPAA